MTELTRQEAEDYLYAEARLLDDRRFDEWLALFTDDAYYWIPSKDDSDPRRETQIVYESRKRLKERVWRVQQTKAYAQSPPSKTRHIVSNVEVDNGADGEARVQCNIVVHEARLDQERSVAGHCEYDLKREDGAWRICMKKVWLLSREFPLYNLTFLI